MGGHNGRHAPGKGNQMLRSVTRLIVPKSIRRKTHSWLRQYFQKEIQRDRLRRAKSIEDSMPHFSLETKHLQNLKVVADREEFLHCLPKGGMVAEIGVAKGDFSDKILTIAKPEKLHLIDWWANEKDFEGLDGMEFVRNRFSKEIELEKVVVIKGISWEVLEDFPINYFDWVYIDTDHSYETTHKELRICQKVVKGDGIIAGHDYVKGNWASNYRYGVIEAVNEFCIKHDWQMICQTHEEDGHLSYMLRRIT